MLRLTYVHLLGLLYPNVATAKIIIKYVGQYIGRSSTSCADSHHKLQNL